MMKQPIRSASVGVPMMLVLGMFASLTTGCGAIDADDLLGLEICDILNCDGLFFANLADGHIDDADDHDDVADDDHADDADDHDDDADDDHADDADDHDDDADDAAEPEDHTHG